MNKNVSRMVDERYKRGLRISCLLNQSVPAAHFVFDFPRDLIGPEEIHRVLGAGEDAEAEALICNPSVYWISGDSGDLLPPSPPAEKATAREISSCRSASSASTIQLIQSSLTKGFNFFSSVETRSRNSFMTL